MYVHIICNQLKEQIGGHIFFDHFFRCNYLLINEGQICEDLKLKVGLHFTLTIQTNIWC